MSASCYPGKGFAASGLPDPMNVTFYWVHMQQPQPDPPTTKQVTILLRRFSDGEQGAGSELMRVIEGELNQIAWHHMRKERQSHTFKLRPWSMRPTFGWSANKETNGGIALISLLQRRT